MEANRRIYRTASTVHAAVGATLAVPVLLVLGATAGGASTVWFIFAPLFAILAWRCWRLGIHTDKEGVQVVGILVSRHVRWSEIDHFAVERLGNYPFVAHVVLRNGQHLPCLGLSSAARPDPERKRVQVQALVDQLNRLLANTAAPTELEPNSQ